MVLNVQPAPIQVSDACVVSGVAPDVQDVPDPASPVLGWSSTEDEAMPGSS